VNELRFEWDLRKAAANRRKHGVTFEEAQAVFADENAVLFIDDDHSQDEDRCILLGLSTKLRILIVCHCQRKSAQIIRIISARKATKRERSHYKGPQP
jgi:uncharacterized protein